MRILHVVFFALISCPPFVASDITLSAKPEGLEVLPGEPAVLSVIITNTSGRDLVVFGDALEKYLCPGAQLEREDGQLVDCFGVRDTTIELPDPRPPSERPHQRFKTGQSVEVRVPVASQDGCSLKDVPPGSYAARIGLKVRILEKGEVATVAASLRCPILIKPPTGADQEVLLALHAQLEKYERETENPRFAGQPLRWGEVMQSQRLKSKDIILTRFPTSTYAGYALRSMPTNTTPVAWSLTCLQDPDAAMRRYCTRGSKESSTQWCVAQARSDLEAYADKAAAFLQAHPDFLYAQEIRHAYAMCLGLTGRLSEALAEVDTLAKGQGKEADDARAFLESQKRGCTKTASPPAVTPALPTPAQAPAQKPPGGEK